MKIGVIGAGWWGKNIVNTLDGKDSVERVVVFDDRPSVRDQFRGNKKTGFVDSLDQILGDPSIRAVCVATPPSTHYGISKDVLGAGKHLLIEKPPASDPREVRELGSLASAKGLVYMLDALYLFPEPVRKLKQILQSGELEDLRYIEMFRIGDELRRENAGISRIRATMFERGVDVVEDLFFHDAAVLLDLFGGFEYRSSKRLRLYDANLSDTIRIDILARGVPVELTLSWTLAGRRRGMVLYDKNYIVEYDALKTEHQLTKHRLETNTRESLSFPPLPPLSALLDFYMGCVEGKHPNPFGAEFMATITEVWRKIAHEY